MKSSYTGDFIAIGLYLTLAGACAYGWIMNIVMIAHSNFNDLTGLLILRLVGIFIAPLGVVLGYV